MPADLEFYAFGACFFILTPPEDDRLLVLFLGSIFRNLGCGMFLLAEDLLPHPLGLLLGDGGGMAFDLYAHGLYFLGQFFGTDLQFLGQIVDTDPAHGELRLPAPQKGRH